MKPTNTQNQQACKTLAQLDTQIEEARSKRDALLVAIEMAKSQYSRSAGFVQMLVCPNTDKTLTILEANKSLALLNNCLADLLVEKFDRYGAKACKLKNPRTKKDLQNDPRILDLCHDGEVWDCLLREGYKFDGERSTSVGTIKSICSDMTTIQRVKQ